MDAKKDLKKIIHVDMDAFYAAIEVRDNPKLKGLPVAVGGEPERRGVIAAASYEARKYGVKSAVSSARAKLLCPGLIIVPPDMKKYKEESLKIREIFSRFTDILEPLSLDEAYLDVTGSIFFKGSATLMASEIRGLIFKETGLTASAGIAHNKFLAKVASDWNKPNGQFVLTPDTAAGFVKKLAVAKIPGVGKVTNEKMQKLGIKTCGDMQKLTSEELSGHFGKFGKTLFYLCRGIDNRDVVTSRERKSLSVERTFAEDLENIDRCIEKVPKLHNEFMQRLERYLDKEEKEIKSIAVKLKFSDFTSTTVERVNDELNIENSIELFIELIREGFERKKMPVRLLGLGVKFAEKPAEKSGEKTGNDKYPAESSNQLALFA